MMTQLPVSLLAVQDLASRFPERKGEIIEQAIRLRERDLILLRESRHLISWHPVQIIKTILVAGVIAFSLSFLLSEVASLGRVYSETKNAGISIPVPIIGAQKITLQSVVPTSTTLQTASRLPAYGWKESLYLGLAAMVTVFLEKAVTTLFQRKKIQQLHGAETDLLNEIHLLKQW